MITNLSITRFKSIKSLTIDCRKVNVFVGAPDTGKTNILEALYFLSRLGWGLPIDDSLRLTSELGFEPLFFRQFLDQTLSIKFQLDAPIHPSKNAVGGISAAIAGNSRTLKVTLKHDKRTLTVPFGGDQGPTPEFNWIRFYSYLSSQSWQYRSDVPGGAATVSPPHGANLLYIARHNSAVYGFLKELLAELKWKLRFDQNAKTFRLSEVRQDEILDYNLDLLSDSLKRLFFYAAILFSSEKATLLLDEPDVYAFPPYPKTLGEMIATDTSNQFFMTTHNPYFLSSLVAKTPAAHLALFVCYRDEDGATGAKRLSQSEVERVIEQGASIFFALEDFLPDGHAS
jgi:hypothetical protein